MLFAWSMVSFFSEKRFVPKALKAFVPENLLNHFNYNKTAFSQSIFILIVICFPIWDVSKALALFYQYRDIFPTLLANIMPHCQWRSGHHNFPPPKNVVWSRTLVQCRARSYAQLFSSGSECLFALFQSSIGTSYCFGNQKPCLFSSLDRLLWLLFIVELYTIWSIGADYFAVLCSMPIQFRPTLSFLLQLRIICRFAQVIGL